MMALGFVPLASVRAAVKSIVPNGVVTTPTTSPPLALSVSVMASRADLPSTVSAVTMYQRFPKALMMCGVTASDSMRALGMNTNVCELHRGPVSSMMWGQVAMNNLISCLATSATARATSPLKVPIRKSTRSSLISLFAALMAVCTFEASSASMMATWRPSTPPRLLYISRATVAPWTSWIEEVLYGLDNGSMMPTLIGSAAYAERVHLVNPIIWSARSPKASAPPAAAASLRNRLRDMAFMVEVPPLKVGHASSCVRLMI